MSSAVLTARDGHIERDLACLHCGYNLRTLSAGASCPECGMAVRTSLRGDRLVEAAPEYLRKVLRGAAFLRWGVMWSLPLIYPGLVIAMVGVWMLTAAQPARDEPARDWWRRWMCRGMMGLGITGMLVVFTMLGYLIASSPLSLFGRSWGGPDMVFIAAHALFVMGLFQLWGWIAALGMRIPDDGLVQGCRQLRRSWLIAVGLIIAIALCTNLFTLLHHLLPALDKHSHWLGGAVLLCLAGVLVWIWLVTLRGARQIADAFHNIMPRMAVNEQPRINADKR